MKCAQGSNLKRLDAVHGVIDRAGGTCKMENVIDWAAIERLVDVDILKLETRIVAQVLDVCLPPSEEVVDCHNRVAFRQQGITQMRAQESGSASHQGTFICRHSFGIPSKV